jgi:hypothetical protein
MNFQSKPPSWLDLESVIPLREPKSRKKKQEREAERERRSAEEITGLSEDTLKRRYPDRIKQLSTRRCGMKLRDAIAISNGQ